MSTLEIPLKDCCNRNIEESYSYNFNFTKNRRRNDLLANIALEPILYQQSTPFVHIYTKDNYSKVIDSELYYLYDTIKASEYILTLEENWDDEGAPSYNKFVWQKAVDFLLEYSELVLKEYNKKIISPKIYHGPNGTIDILFENSNYTLLINILEDGLHAEYFGQDKRKNTAKGTINLSNINKSLIPLANNL